MTATDDKVTLLDLRGEKWDLYRLATGGWCVKFHAPGEIMANRSVQGVTIEAALDAAVACPPLPVIPRRPTRVGSVMTERRTGNKWALIVDGSFYAGNLATKRSADALGERVKARAAAEADEWNTKYLATVANGTEGVDWRWER